MASARLVLADGSVFEGRAAGAPGPAGGEVVFNTSMTGYQEMLTDPSYAGQLLVLTYPLIGNYGVDRAVEESGRIQPRGLIVREIAPVASHPRASGDLAGFLAERGVVAIEGVDTRAITRRIRRHGVMPGAITAEPVGEALERVRALPGYDGVDWVAQVSTANPYDWRDRPEPAKFRVALIDGGVKHNIMRSLTARGCAVSVLPIDTSAAAVLALAPDGVVWSPGPGDPQVQHAQVAEARKLIGAVPLFGICLGHQIIARALGAGTFKLPFGHRGGNHPVRDERTGAVTITAQNHGYAVDPDGLAASAEGKPRELERRHGRRDRHARRAGDGYSVSFRGQPGTAGQHGNIRSFCGPDGRRGGRAMTRTTALRPATTADASAVASIAHALQGETNTGLPPDLYPAAAQAWLARLDERGAAALALDGSIPVAFGARSERGRPRDCRTGRVGAARPPPAGHRHAARGPSCSHWHANAATSASAGGCPKTTSPLSASFLPSGVWCPLRNPDMTFELPL